MSHSKSKGSSTSLWCQLRAVLHLMWGPMPQGWWTVVMVSRARHHNECSQWCVGKPALFLRPDYRLFFSCCLFSGTRSEDAHQQKAWGLLWRGVHSAPEKAPWAGCSPALSRHADLPGRGRAPVAASRYLSEHRLDHAWLRWPWQKLWTIHDFSAGLNTVNNW